MVLDGEIQDKDTSKYNLALGQVLDSIRSRIGYVSVSEQSSQGSATDNEMYSRGRLMICRLGVLLSDCAYLINREIGFLVCHTLFMPAFDPVRDAVLNSPVESRLTSSHSLAVILNDDTNDRPSSRSSLPHILAHAEPIRRSSMDLNHLSSSSTIPYSPKVRITPPGSVLTPLSQAEIDKYKNFRGQGLIRLGKRKRSASEEIHQGPATTKHAGDVGVVVEHCEWPHLTLVS